MKYELHEVFSYSRGCCLLASIASSEKREKWISLSARIHGAFIPIGIRIGLDAQSKLHVEPRGLAVIYYSGAKAPCPCIADGIMIATQASPDQGTLLIAQKKAPEGVLAHHCDQESEDR
ncbi:FmdE family protein [Bradyrhizobium sp. BR13661]|jgi:hypothetical protein|uniref:FmdE family protein n=1 Tax=Bradyrhizobium sp. BR13661 TaxID=2940622 RepID=UPI002474D049|nr:FmdE family protein [Bradyrhizobium sp. BR13661]MDH6260790.1 hypothetical protein [Bradyrhizobium sp. BR13661]